MALDERQILNYIGTELQQSAGGNENDFVDADRKAALATYLGQPNGKEVEGSSSVTSTDVADVIEWIMPEVVKAFTQNNDVVTFDPVFDGDEDQADLESSFVYDTLMKDNNGFLIIHQFVKDALLQKNGFIKCFYDKVDCIKTESYTGLTEMEMDLVLANPSVELQSRTDYEIDNIPVSDIKISINRSKGKISIISVPPEEFRASRQHNSLDLSSIPFSAHVMLKTAGDLVAEGYDREFVDTIPSSSTYEDDREYRFYMQGETTSPDRNNSLDPSQRLIEISECYANMDIDDDGIAEFVKVEVAGGDNPDVLLSVEEIPENPFISATAILMSHKLLGLSIYDRIKSIQEQKTTLWRNIFDNMYLQNNQKTVVVENQVNIDDLLVSRPGGIIRAKRLDAVSAFPTAPLSTDSYKMMDYLDQVRASRSGVSPEGPVTDSMIGDRVGSQGVERMMSQKEELVGLMIRVIAETGIKPLCYMIRKQMMKHSDLGREYKHRGKWVKIDPSKWIERSNTTVRVGTGSGNKKELSANLTNLLAIQKEIMAFPSQSLVKEEHLYNTVDDLVKASGLPGASRYLLDPKSPEGQEFKKQNDESAQEQQKMQQEQEQALAQAQMKIANAEEQKAKSNAQNIMLQAENEQVKSQISAMTAQHNAEQAQLKQQLEEAKVLISTSDKSDELDYKYWDSKERYEVERERIAATAKAASDNNANKSKD